MEAGESSRDAVLDGVAARSASQIGSENFPVALRVLPKRAREQLARVYSYARFVDDVGDEAPGDRLRLLDLVEQDVRLLDDGRPRLAAVAGLRPLIDECAVPLQPFLDLIEANRVDQRRSSYETFEDLLDYCRLSAAPVGRIVLHIAGAAAPANVAGSDEVCAALQVLEHCQDVGEDARAGRVYLPAVDLRTAGVDRDELLAATTGPRLRGVVADQVARADDLLRAGPALACRLSGWARLAVAGYVAGGQATSAALRRARFDVLGQEIRPSGVSTAARAVRVAARWW
ncbi:MAG: squalene synthase HpnC [Jatrophihabitantaceae bacterium]